MMKYIFPQLNIILAAEDSMLCKHRFPKSEAIPKQNTDLIEGRTYRAQRELQ
jgi:hypothetical protein